MRSLPCVLTLLLAACAGTPSGPPEMVAEGILADLDAGRPQAAAERFRAAAADADVRQRIYPMLYGDARRRYESGDYASAGLCLEFLAEHYPDAAAVREALVYALFLERSRLPAADPELVERIGRALTAVHERSVDPPAWLDLVAAQNALDQARPEQARVALARFHAGWDGHPAGLQTYIEDLDRYLASH